MKFFLWNQNINSLIPIRRMNLWCLIIKMKEIMMWIRVFLNWKTNFNSKNGKRSFSFETKASIPFIPMKRMCLSYPIIKRNKIVMWIHVCPNRRTNINFKNGRNRSFFYETKASISFIPMRKMCLGCPITKKKGDYYVNSCFSLLTNEFCF